MKIKGIGLFSGGLDSILAVKVIGGLGVEVTGVAFETPFFDAVKAKAIARNIELPLMVMDITDEHLLMLGAPRYGYGKNMNPCIDCHILMLKKAGEVMEETGADFLFTGEVLGQRPMSQGKQSLHIVASRSGYGGYVLRPLSAKLLPETIPEREGTIDREKLLDIQGRSRKRQIEMARNYGISGYSNPAGGCLLTDPMFSRRLKDLFEHRRDHDVRDIELLKYGRHLRLSQDAKAIVGRREGENKTIEDLSRNGDVIIKARDYPGPTVLVPYGCDDETIEVAASICILYSDAPNNSEVTAVCRTGDTSHQITAKSASKDDVKDLMI
ncbi:MAG: tRNA 4-thiouridine(8) synthase ThiI [Thermodesulfobacteriota bacterium]|nr:tRNA 4-thiouridine(8) synthase ThiI [Thermodesulfobacteriota bacterium]